MFRKITVALLATTLFAAPVLAQSTMVAPRAPVTQPVKGPAVKTSAITAKPAFAKANKTVKITKVKKHQVKKHAVKKHKVVKHSKVTSTGKHITGKSSTPSHHN